ncbi:MAG: hypothetical protein IJ626_03285 [Muribaculaceae bacterium]|nr:hypothetical protein [Muribaculaceae bacterium]
MKKNLFLFLVLLPLAIASCGGDDKDEPSGEATNHSSNRTAQVFQLKDGDTFTLDGIQFTWWIGAYSQISSSDVNLKFYITGKSNINEVKIPDVAINIWRDNLPGGQTYNGVIMAVEKSSGTYIYYCIFCENVFDGANYNILGQKLTIYRLK